MWGTILACWEEDAEDGAASGASAHRYLCVMLVEDTFGNPETEAGSGFAFSGDEGMKEPLEHLPVHAGAVVGDRDGYS
jgi:hypothetical protein